MVARKCRRPLRRTRRARPRPAARAAHRRGRALGRPRGAGSVRRVTSRTNQRAGHSESAEALWGGLDEAWRVAFPQAGEAFRGGNIAVGACVTDAAGAVVHASRNRVADGDGPRGEVFGSTLAHAEVNVLARLPFGLARELVLTTTLEPCLQCSAAIRLGPISTVHFAGSDPLWAGCHDFGPLSPREAERRGAELIGPRRDELGVFGAVIARFGPTAPGQKRFSGRTGSETSWLWLSVSGKRRLSQGWCRWRWTKPWGSCGRS